MTSDDLRAWRERRGETQAEAAALLRVPTDTYRNWETGRSPVPRPVTLLIAYIEQFGPIDAATMEGL